MPEEWETYPELVIRDAQDYQEWRWGSSSRRKDIAAIKERGRIKTWHQVVALVIGEDLSNRTLVRNAVAKYTIQKSLTSWSGKDVWRTSSHEKTAHPLFDWCIFIWRKVSSTSRGFQNKRKSNHVALIEHVLMNAKFGKYKNKSDKKSKLIIWMVKTKRHTLYHWEYTFWNRYGIELMRSIFHSSHFSLFKSAK